MRFIQTTFRLCLSVSVALGLLAACGDDDDNGGGGPTDTGQACNAASQCYPKVEDGALSGEALCLDRVEGGYCTHLCVEDNDCCAAPGECMYDYAQVCSPFESGDDKYCFLTCEDADVALTDAVDGEEYCQRFANVAFHCRSSGGGSENRKVCVP
jgi:hypothetical protein